MKNPHLRMVPVEIITLHDPPAWLSTVDDLQGRHGPHDILRLQQSILQITAGRLLAETGVSGNSNLSGVSACVKVAVVAR